MSSRTFSPVARGKQLARASGIMARESQPSAHTTSLPLCSPRFTAGAALMKTVETVDTARAQTATEKPLAQDELKAINAWWRACNYLSVGMIYLRDDPLLSQPLKAEDVKLRLLGHWGASPAL